MAPIDWDAVPVLVRRSNLQVQDNAYDINGERMSLKFVIQAKSNHDIYFLTF